MCLPLARWGDGAACSGRRAVDHKLTIGCKLRAAMGGSLIVPTVGMVGCGLLRPPPSLRLPLARGGC